MFSFKRIFLALAAVAAIAFSSNSAYADPVTVYSTRAAWEAATTAFSTINFEGIAPANSVANFSSPLNISGVIFSGNATTGQISVVDSGFFAPLFQFNSGAVLSGFAFVDVTLPAGTTAFAADVMTTNPDGRPLAVLLSNGETFSLTPPLRPGRGFFGFTSDVPILSIRFTPTGAPTAGIPLMDNASFGQAGVAPVPEPTTIVMLGIGTLGLVVSRRRKMK